MTTEAAHQFLIIRPGDKTTEIITGVLGPAFNKRIIGTDRVDHGGLVRADEGRGLSIVVPEFGLYDGLDGIYCALGRNLRSGNIIVYAHDYGETVDIANAEIELVKSAITWFDNGAQAAAAIVEGMVDRPRVKVNGKTVWEWPSTEKPW